MAIKLAPVEEPTVVGKAPPLEPEAAKGNGLAGDITEIPPSDAPRNLSKYARFVASEEVVAAKQAKAHACMLCPPPKNSYARTHPDNTLRLNLHVLVHEVGNKKKTYLIDPGLQTDPDLEGLTKIVMVVPYVTHHKPPKLGLWPVSIEHENNPWIQSALNIVEALKQQWLKVIPVTARGEYITRPPSVLFGEPNWGGMPGNIDGWLDLAFQETDWLTPDNWTDHPVRKALRTGE